MEKFRSTADASTGVHPYLPPPPPPFKPLHPVLALPRLALLLLALPLVLLLHIAHRLRVAPTLAGRLLASAASSLLLLTLSYPRARLIPLYRNAKSPPTPPPKRSPALIVTNLHSPLPVLHLSSLYAPPFLFPTRTSLSHLSPSSLYTLLSTGKLPLEEQQQQNSQSPLHSFLSSSFPTVLLAEGASTNGKGLLAFPPTALAAIIEASKSVPVFAIGYAAPRAATFCGVGSFPRYILHMMGSWRTPVFATYVQVQPDQIRNVQAILARCVRAPPLAITRDGRDEFDAHWNDTRPSSYR